MFRTYSIAQLLDFADSLDPNNGWRESLADDDSITRDALADAMLGAYDDADTHAWINKPLAAGRQVDIDKILQLLKKAQALGLNFDIGSAYIRREYINQQTTLNAEIDAILKDFQ
jgi:hypothetical protein